MTETPPFDPFLWLEDIENEKSLRWVREQNEKTISQLTLQTDYHQIYTEIAGIILANDRVLYYENINGGHSGSATLSDKLRIMALTYTYFWNQLK